MEFSKPALDQPRDKNDTETYSNYSRVSTEMDTLDFDTPVVTDNEFDIEGNLTAYKDSEYENETSSDNILNSERYIDTSNVTDDSTEMYTYNVIDIKREINTPILLDNEIILNTFNGIDDGINNPGVVFYKRQLNMPVKETTNDTQSSDKRLAIPTTKSINRLESVNKSHSVEVSTEDSRAIFRYDSNLSQAFNLYSEEPNTLHLHLLDKSIVNVADDIIDNSIDSKTSKEKKLRPVFFLQSNKDKSESSINFSKSEEQLKKAYLFNNDYVALINQKILSEDKNHLINDVDKHESTLNDEKIEKINSQASRLKKLDQGRQMSLKKLIKSKLQNG